MTSTPATTPPRTFFGQPRALGYLAFTEAWERFSYYGMTSLLVLYMTQALFMPGRIQGVAGFSAFRGGLEHLFGPLSTLALASQVYGLYTAFVYFTPVLGGVVADRFIGRRAAVVSGALLLCAGQVAMAFDATFLLALLCLIVGCGLLKGNISSQVGELYAEDDGEGRTRGFSIFSMGINLGAVGGPLMCGLLAQLYGWHVGFALSGMLMLIGLCTYLIGYKHMPQDHARARDRAATPPLDAAQWRSIVALVTVAAITVFQSVAYYQNSNIGLVWINRYVDLNLLGFHVPVAWFVSIDPLASVIFVPVLFALWRRQAAKGREPGDIGKIAVGAWIAAGANLLLALAAFGGGRASVLFPIAYDVLLGVGFLYYWPPLLALVSRTAPTQLKATLMGAVFLSLFTSNIIIGWIGGFYEKMTPSGFWLMSAAISSVGGVLAMVLARPLKRWLTPQPG